MCWFRGSPLVSKADILLREEPAENTMSRFLSTEECVSSACRKYPLDLQCFKIPRGTASSACAGKKKPNLTRKKDIIIFGYSYFYEAELVTRQTHTRMSCHDKGALVFILNSLGTFH